MRQHLEELCGVIMGCGVIVGVVVLNLAFYAGCIIGVVYLLRYLGVGI